MLSTILDIFLIIKFHLIELAKNMMEWRNFFSDTIADNKEVMEIKENIAIKVVTTYIRVLGI